VKPDPFRVRQHRGLDGRRRSLPLPTRLLLGLSVLALGAAVFLTASGGIGPLVATLGSGFSSAFGRLIATPLPSASEIVATNSPIIDPPASPYSKVATVDLEVTIPADVVGDPNARLRLYVALAGLKPAPVREVAIGTTINMMVPVTLTQGRNDFTATIVRSGVESEASPVVSVTFDNVPPKITIRSPKDGTTVATPSVTISGATEARTTLVARNSANGASITAVAAADGTFTIVLPIVAGSNAIHIDATDLAGNTSALDVTYVQGSGQMKASLIASVYRISVSNHPASLQLTAIVTDPTGAPLAGATAFFTLQIPGLAPISGQGTTDAAGRASFTTPLVGAMGTGNGQATVLVTHPVFGQTTARVGLIFVA
jgi:hypothetical protein